MITRNSLLIFLALAFSGSCTTEDRDILHAGNLVATTVDQDPALPSAQINGALLHTEAFGPPEATMIVAIHGGPGADYRYLLPCKDLADEGYRVVFYDQRGSGLSQRFPKDSYTDPGQGGLDLMYEELKGVIAHYRTHAGQQVVLLGHSWGGILATGFAGRYPDAVQGIIVCEPGGLQWKDIETYVRESRSFKLWSELLNDVAYLDQFITGKKDQHEILDYKVSMLATQNDITGEGTFDPGISWRSGAVISDALFTIGERYQVDFSAGISHFKKPVLFFYSERNTAYPDSWAQHISGVYPSVQLLKVPAVGHNGIITNEHAWKETTRPAILTYLSTLP